MGQKYSLRTDGVTESSVSGLIPVEGIAVGTKCKCHLRYFTLSTVLLECKWHLRFMAMVSTRQRLTQAALELFLSQGISHTTTRQIADRAGVNEATLFRNFGNKYGLFLAVLQPSPEIAAPPLLIPEGESAASLRSYARECLQVLNEASSFIRSIIGEADQYLPEHRQALQQRLEAIQQEMAQNLRALLAGHNASLSVETSASILGSLLLGYTLLESISGYGLWNDREAFLDTLGAIFPNEPDAARDRGSKKTTPMSGDIVQSPELASAAEESQTTLQSREAVVIDLPPVWVHHLLRQAKTLGAQDYALVYVLFGAGLLPEEVVGLEKAHRIADKSQHILHVMGPNSRQVAVNQWILGKRYGSYLSNPLSKWLKSRKDNHSAMFINPTGESMAVQDIRALWERWVQGIDTGAIAPEPWQARQTWCVEMLMKGISLENLSILAGMDVSDLQPYAQRAKEKAAIAAATELDRKTPSPAG